MIDALRTGLIDRVTQSRVLEALRVHGAEAGELTLIPVADRLARFINFVPEALSTLTRLGKEGGYGRAIAFGTSQVLLYVMDEQDLLPDSAHDPIGILDDAYLVHKYLTGVYHSYPAARARVNESLLAEVSTIEFVAHLLPDGVAAALDRTCESLLTVGSALFSTAETPKADVREPLFERLRFENALKSQQPGTEKSQAKG